MINDISIEQRMLDARWDRVAHDIAGSAKKSCVHMSDTLKKLYHNIETAAERAFCAFRDKLIVTPLPPIILNVNILCTDIEKIFNLTGCIPGIGALTGLLRISFGQIQIIAGIALMALGGLGSFMVNDRTEDAHLLRKWNSLSAIGLEYNIHGCLNILRGSGELLIGDYTFRLGNLLFLAPNVANGHDFNPYFAYGTLTHRVIPVDKV